MYGGGLPDAVLFCKVCSVYAMRQQLQSGSVVTVRPRGNSNDKNDTNYFFESHARQGLSSPRVNRYGRSRQNHASPWGPVHRYKVQAVRTFFEAQTESTF